MRHTDTSLMERLKNKGFVRRLFGIREPMETITTVKPGDAHHKRAESLLTGATDGIHPEYHPIHNRYPNASPLLQFLEDSDIAMGERMTQQGIYKQREEGIVDMTLIPGDLPPDYIDTNGQHERDKAFLEKVDEATRRGRVVVVGTDVHIGMRCPTLLAALAAMPKMLVIDSVPVARADNIDAMIKELEVYEPSPLPSDRPWVEMNTNTFQRRRKRSRPDRKGKYKDKY